MSGLTFGHVQQQQRYPGSQQCVITSTYAAVVAMRCNAGDSLNGTTCTHPSSYTSTTNYSCPGGGSLSGSTCSRNDNYAASVNYSCNAGDGLSGSTCLHTNYVQAEVNYSCPNGDTLHYMTCSTPVSTPAATSYNCNGLISNGAGLCNGEGTLSSSYYEAWDVCQAKENVYGLSLNSVTLVSGRRYNCVFNANTAYSCPNGGTLSGAQCLSSSSYAATPNYSCGAGTLTGTQCAVPQNYAATVNYSCPGGDPLSGSTCLKTTVYTATPSYSCPSGGSLNGTSCTVTSAYAATPDYSCTGADTLNGSTCTRTTTIAATPAYSCPNGAAPLNGQCTGTNSTSTAYIYLGGKQIAETVVGGATQYVHTDALGSPVAHTSQAGAETSRTKFEPYGYTAGGTKPGPAMAGMSTTGSAIGFAGHVNDLETDLVYMQQRYYDPIAGRFLSVDPVVTDASSGGNFNRYAYANNHPYKYIDADGRFPFLIPFIPYISGATAVIVGHYVLPGRKGREDTARAAGNAILNNGKSAEGKKDTEKKPAAPAYPGNDPTVAPPDYEWRGKPGSKPGDGNGNYVNPETGESLRPDLNHPSPIGPHWDHRDPDGNWGRLYPDGTRVAK